MLAKIEGVNYTAIIGESAKIDVKQAINYIKSGQAEISETVGDIIGEFNDNAVEKTNTFNQNAIDKTAEFDLNASNKTGAFNTNATNKTTNYNDNATSKTGVFDSNAVDKTTDFNNNASNKTTDFNNNYLEKKALIDAEVAKSKTWAEGTDGEVTPLGGTHSAKVWAEIAEAAASGVQNPANRDLSNLTTAGQMIIDSQNSTISNCILEIPQDINLELSSGTLTLKSGSKVYRPNGVDQFASLSLAADKTLTYTTNGTYWVVVQISGNLSRCLANATSGSTAPESPTAGTLWYDTTNNYCKRYDGSSWINVSFPIASITVSDGAISSIDKVFNGAGYIGHHAFVLPGVKGLAPNGKNTDGTLKSSSYNQTVLSVAEIKANIHAIGTATSLSACIAWGYYSEVDNIIGHTFLPGERVYEKQTNKLYAFNADTVRILMPVVLCSSNGTTVTKFDILQPYEGVRNLLTDDLEEQISTKQVDVTTLTGYDATQTQTLKNVNGTLTWLTD